MEFEYRKATIEDLDLLMKTRIEVLRAANQLSSDTDMSEVETESYQYYKTAFESDSHTAYLIFDQGRFIGAGGISYYTVMPTYHNPSGKKAYIMNMYTNPAYRRKGIATKTLDLLIQDAKNRGIKNISLEATDMGKPLYEKYGFVPMMSEMELPMDMHIVVKQMESDSEIRGKAYVHWKSWQDAYIGLVDQAYLDSHTLEKCTDIAFHWLNNIIVAKVDDKVVGFVGYGPYRDDSLPETGEVYSIYILKEYYDQKVGYKLMSAAIDQLSEYPQIAVWVLEGNHRAIKFYERYGFRFDGTKKQITLGTVTTEIRMVLAK